MMMIRNTTFFGFLWMIPLLVDAKLVMKIVLNKGQVLPIGPQGPVCNANDIITIKNVLSVTDRDNRQLMDDLDDEDIFETEEVGQEEHRQLWPAKCRSDCAGLATGTCFRRDCIGFRRRTAASTSSNNNKLRHHRNLNAADDMVCTDGIKKLNQQIDIMIPKLSLSCQDIVRTKREVTCFDDVRYAQVDGFTLWNADTDTIVKEKVKDGDSFCYTNSNLNIEAVANACVEEVEIRLDGPVSDNENVRGVAPYTIFGYTTQSNLLGRKLPIGKYTITTEIDKSLLPQPKLSFTIKKC